MPTLLTLVVVRLSMDSHSSRGRIKLLESDETYRERLVNVVGGLEKRVEDAVADLVDGPGNSSTPGSSSPSSSSPSPPPEADPTSASSSTVNKVEKEEKVKKHKNKKCKEEKKEAPKAQMSDLQLKMAEHMNAVPNLKKELAFIDPTMNSHAVIVARDVKRFKHHEKGWGVLRHLADNFII